MQEANLMSQRSGQKALFRMVLLTLLTFLAAGYLALCNSLTADVRSIAAREDCRNRLTSGYIKLLMDLKSPVTQPIPANACLDEYLESHAIQSRWLCPAASGPATTSYCFNPRIRIAVLLSGGYAGDIVIACDSAVENHCIEQNSWVNFLLADGSVCSRQVEVNDFKRWITQFRRGEVDRFVPTN